MILSRPFLTKTRDPRSTRALSRRQVLQKRLHWQMFLQCERPLLAWIQRRGSCCATRPLLALRARADPVSRFRDSVRVLQRPPFSRCALGRTPATHVAPPRGWLLRCSSPRLGSLLAAQDHLRRESEPQKPRKRLITATLWGARRPDAGVRPSTQCEKGGRCKTRTLSMDRAPRKPRKRLITATLWGARRPDAGVRPNEVRRGDARTTQTPSYSTALGRVAKQKPPPTHPLPRPSGSHPRSPSPVTEKGRDVLLQVVVVSTRSSKTSRPFSVTQQRAWHSTPQ